ncbi:MAG TPA: metal-dependent hydrolase [Burkholderiales bacterium]|nr:metal-dependent hydrolase [Burkholderiales bacterium]
MPTIITHALVPAAIAVGLGQRVIPARLAAAGAIAAMVPDVDVLGLKLGIPHGSDFGHRGFTHSLAFAAALAFAGGSWRGWLFLFLAVTSHGMLDAFTNGGAGIEFFWPFSDQRHFAPWRPIEVSPLGIRGFFSARGVEVLKSEVIWVWLPTLALALALFAARRRQ